MNENYTNENYDYTEYKEERNKIPWGRVIISFLVLVAIIIIILLLLKACGKTSLRDDLIEAAKDYYEKYPDMLPSEIGECFVVTLADLEKEGLIQIYHYPKRPESIPKDDLDLLERTIEYTKMNNGSVNKLTFERLLYLHPNLLKKVNETLSDMGELTYQKEELTDIFEKFIFKQMTNPEKEYFLKSSMLQISTTYPNLTNSLKQKIEIFSKSKEEKVERLITLLSNSLENNPEVFKMQMQSLYLKDPRSLKEISREILEKYQLTKATKEPNILK